MSEHDYRQRRKKHKRNQHHATHVAFATQSMPKYLKKPKQKQVEIFEIISSDSHWMAITNGKLLHAQQRQTPLTKSSHDRCFFSVFLTSALRQNGAPVTDPWLSPHTHTHTHTDWVDIEPIHTGKDSPRQWGRTLARIFRELCRAFNSILLAFIGLWYDWGLHLPHCSRCWSGTVDSLLYPFNHQ